MPPGKVQVQAVEYATRPRTEEAVGTIRAKSRATVEAKISGRIAEMPLTLGQRVKEGDLLARIDAAEYKARLQQAEAGLAQAQRDWDRVSTLLKSETATRSEADAAEAKLLGAKAAVAEANTMLGYADVSAPFAGVITRKLADAGDFATPGKPLAELENPKFLRLEADVPESIGQFVKVGDRLQVRTGSVNPVEGVVTEVAPAADPASRTFLVKVDLPEMQGARSGQFGRLLIPTGELKSLRIPSPALVQRGQLDIVFVLDQQQAKMRLVKAGRTLGDQTEILAGLEPGDKVIVAGSANLKEGQRVEAQ